MPRAAPAPASSNYANWPAVQASLSRNIYIAGNTVSDQYWGRGISVVGGSDITIDSNNLSRTPAAASIYLARETAYMTFGDHNILVQNNALSQIETMQPSYKPPNIVIAAAAHGAIEISSTVYSDEYANPTGDKPFRCQILRSLITPLTMHNWRVCGSESVTLDPVWRLLPTGVACLEVGYPVWFKELAFRKISFLT